jgi:hypothetical protein
MASNEIRLYYVLDLDNSSPGEALQKFIDTSLLDLPWIEQYPPDVQEHIKKVLRGRSQGSFPWAHVALLSLQRVPASDMTIHLDILPEELDVLYDWQLRHIEIDQRICVRGVLKWCRLSEKSRCCLFRPRDVLHQTRLFEVDYSTAGFRSVF